MIMKHLYLPTALLRIKERERDLVEVTCSKDGASYVVPFCATCHGMRHMRHHGSALGWRRSQKGTI